MNLINEKGECNLQDVEKFVCVGVFVRMCMKKYLKLEKNNTIVSQIQFLWHNYIN